MALELDPNLTPAEAGRLIYEMIWLKVQNCFYWRNRLQNWADWQTRFHGQIVDIESGVRFARKMLASLGDKHTFLIGKARATRDEARLEMNDADDVVYAEMLPHNIGYLSILSFSRLRLAEFLEAALKRIESADGFIFDLRKNDGGLVESALQCAELILPWGRLIEKIVQTEHGVVKITVGLTSTEQVREMTIGDVTFDPVRTSRRRAVLQGKPVVVLIDARTASSAEILLSVLIHYGKKHGKLWVFGSAPTVGKGKTNCPIDIYGLATLQITDGVWLDSEGVWFGDCGKTVERGVRPQRYVSETQALSEAYNFLCKVLGKPVKVPVRQQSGVGLGGLLVAGALVVVAAAAAVSNKRGA